MGDITIVKEKKNFDFVDTIRCISMIGIVFEHSTVLWGDFFKRTGDRLIQASAIQSFKFATIAFFLIGGFLINHKFTEYTPFQYIKNRFKNTIGPWLFWVTLLILLDIGHIAFMSYKFGHQPEPFFPFLFEDLRRIVFYTSYWFIFNFLLCIAILLFFKKYIYSLWFGAFWGAVSLFYSVNLYYGWIPTEHTTALFGFVFYLWLGVYFSKYYDKVSIFISKISWTWMILINVVLFLLADLEILHLMQIGSADSFNTLRLSNILYSLTMFLLLLKMGPLKGLQKYLKPRETTFGIYLIHQIWIFRLLPELFRPFNLKVEEMTVYGAVGYTILRFIVVYGLTFLLVKLLLKTRFKWIIGIGKSSNRLKNVSLKN